MSDAHASLAHWRVSEMTMSTTHCKAQKQQPEFESDPRTLVDRRDMQQSNEGNRPKKNDINKENVRYTGWTENEWEAVNV